MTLSALLRPLALVAVLLLWLPVAALAQDRSGAISEAEYQEWEGLAARAEEVVDRALATTPALEVLRTDLTDWRSRFRDRQTQQSARITSLQEQIAALGPVPEVAEDEPADITDQRATLSAQLAEVAAPGRRATAAFERADGLISEIDQIIATRETNALLVRDLPAWNLTHVWAAVGAAGVYVTRLSQELQAPFATENDRAQLGDRLLGIGLYGIAALLLLFRAGPWTTRLLHPLGARFSQDTGQATLTLLMAALRVILPVLGLIAVAQALRLSGVVGLRATALIDLLPWLGAVVMTAAVLGRLSFGDGPRPMLTLPDTMRAEGLWHARMLGFLLAGVLLVQHILKVGDATPYIGILSLPLVVAGALILWRIARLMFEHARAELEEVEEPPFAARALRQLARFVVAVSLVSPVLAIVGYNAAADALLWPTVYSLGLIAALWLVQETIYDLYPIITRAPGTAREALVPALLSLCVAVASIPVFALIWGVRAATLGELWTRFLNGVSLGGAEISPKSFLIFVIVFSLLFMATRLLQGVLRSTVLPKTKLDGGGRNAIVAGTGYVGIILAAFIAITSAGIDLSGLAIVAGALSVGIGFGLQAIVSNFVSGIILLIERPIKLGDWITVGSVSGYVRAISVRSTRIETFDRQDVIVPNADLIAAPVTNYTHGNSTGRLIVPVGVAYGTDTRKVEAILREIAEAHPMVLLVPPPSIVFQGFGADSLDFEIRAILRDVDWLLSTKSELNHEIARRFVEEGIEIPFMQRDIWIKNPEALAVQPEDTT